MSQKMKSEIFETDLSFNNLNTVNSEEESIRKKRSIPFWSENPNIIFDQLFIFEFFPIDNMSYEQKLNAITRTVIILTILGYVFSQNIRVLIIGLLTIGIIYLMHYYHTVEKEKVEMKKGREGFVSEPVNDYLISSNIHLRNDVFQEPDSGNPFSNVMMTDYDYNPNKKPAPPSFNENVNKKILSEAKQLVVEANPDQPDIADKLFKDLGEQLVFEQSLRQFTSNPGTTIPNDQGAFAEFCYGSMISCKEGNNFACARNTSHYTNY